MDEALYFECGTGISGDMAVAALLDLGADEDTLRRALESLRISGFEIKISRVKKSGLDVCDFQVVLDEAHENHDHDMEYLHGDVKDHHHHSHSHRGLKEILDIIDCAGITDRAKDTAARIFKILAQAEAKAHGVPIDQVHFHEVGAVDSIVDIVAFSVCLDNLDITDIIVSQLNEGTGFVRCQHGMIPVPVPAVSNIAQAYGLPLCITGIQGELVTPTGAAIVAAVRSREPLPGRFRIRKTGMGAGKRNYDMPSILRAMLIEADTGSRDCIYKLETEIDDSTGEMLGNVMERLFAAGARDVHYLPVYMKKNRPAYQLNVICTQDRLPALEQIIFEDTTTIGIRRIRMERSVLERETASVNTSLGTAQVKICTLPDGGKKVYPEYASVAALSRENGVSFQQAYCTIYTESNE